VQYSALLLDCPLLFVVLVVVVVVVVVVVAAAAVVLLVFAVRETLPCIVLSRDFVDHRLVFLSMGLVLSFPAFAQLIF